jgi:myo-inositol-1(or 4)-monophosphatase
MSINNEDFWGKVLVFCQKITDKVGQQLMLDFGRVHADQKSDGSLVTASDKWADQEIRTAIALTFPTHGILSEEAEHIYSGADWCWIIDPIDGTTNFTRGLPIWGISLGLLYQGTPVFGYVHFPPINQTFHGFLFEDKKESYLNNQRIYSSKDQPTKNHFFSLCARSIEVLTQKFPCKIRMLGVATYNFLAVANGATLGGVEATPKIWDIAAVWVIIQAAGGVWVALDNQQIFPLQTGKNYGEKPFPSLIVSQPELVDLFRPYVQFLGERNMNK